MIYPDAVWRPGQNAGYRAGRNAMRLCVCHYTVGRLAGDLSIMDRGYFNFLVARDGTVYQGAETDATTWHAGTANPYGPGVEVSYHPDYDDELWTPEAYAATARLVEWLIGLGIRDEFYDGPRIDPAGYEGFLCHRAVQQPDGHADWWPELPRTAPIPSPPTPENHDMRGILLHKPGEAAVYLCVGGTKKLVRSTAELEGHKFLAPRTGLIVDGPDNGAYEASVEYLDGLHTIG